MLVALALGLHSGVHVGGGAETLAGRGLWRYYISIFIPVLHLDLHSGIRLPRGGGTESFSALGFIPVPFDCGNTNPRFSDYLCLCHFLSLQALHRCCRVGCFWVSQLLAFSLGTGQARKGAATAGTLCAGVWLAGLPPISNSLILR